MYKTKFDGLLVTLASVEDVEKWSHGVVDNPDTVNYRTGKPKQSGLFCESIFGPIKNYECSCGKYKGIRYKGIVCERCGVEVTNARVRRTRMGHIELAVPVVHAWYKSSPSGGVNHLLNLSANEIDKIVSFVKYVLIKPVDDATKKELLKQIQDIYDERLKELEGLYQEEINGDMMNVETLIASTKAYDDTFPAFSKAIKSTIDKYLKASDTDKIELLTTLKNTAKDFMEQYANFIEELSTNDNKVKEYIAYVNSDKSEDKKASTQQKNTLKAEFGLDFAVEKYLEKVDFDLAYNLIVISKVTNYIAENKKDVLKNLEDSLKNMKKGVGVDNKKRNQIDKLYKDNKDSLDLEFNRIKSIVADLSFGSTIYESDYRNIFANFTEVVSFASGPDAILRMLQTIDVEKEIFAKIKELTVVRSEEQKKKLFNLIKLLINLYVSGVKPENMIIRKLPVIPPDLRPVVQLDGGKFASSDVNLFYRRVLMRNIRLKKMIQVGMPDVVKKNEIRLLQESVNNLLVGEKGGGSMSGAGVKVFKSLSDMLSGKEGIFRKNLLGKRVDYSGRSIITVGPDLKLSECGLPLYIAVKIFTPFIIGKLIEKKIVYTPKQAEKLIKEESPIALKFLEEVIKGKYVLLNRAPTLHRLSIEAFKIKLMPGKTIRLHPLVCPSFNADFDGDQMAVHLPISEEAQEESKNLIAADKNILRPNSGEPTIAHGQDMVLGIYYLTDHFDKKNPQYITEQDWKEKRKPIGMYNGIDEVVQAYNNSELRVKDKITLVYEGEAMETTTGRVLFNSILPEKIRFVNKKLINSDLKKLLSKIFDEYGMEITVYAADAIKDFGFKYATLGSTTINVLDMKVPQEKEALLNLGDEQANEVYKYFYKGYFSEDEKHRLIVKIWTNIKAKVENSLKAITLPGEDLYTMVDSKARGSQTHLTQISGMKGLVVNPRGEIIELPIKKSYVEGLRPIEYFISAHAGRKGKADTALRTAESGYLTRKLCDASQEVIVRHNDCGTERSVIYTKEEYEMRGEDFYSVIYGRVLADDIEDKNGNVVLHQGTMLDKESTKLMENLEIKLVKLRTPLICNTVSGVCQKCYGMDLSTRAIVEIGVPVGVIAAQSIGEPATQLTLQTFHSGGIAGKVTGKGGDMSQGIERIKQLFEVRAPKNPAVIAPFDGTVSYYMEESGNVVVRVISEYRRKSFLVKKGYEVSVKKGDMLKKGSVYATKAKSKLKIDIEGKVLQIDGDRVTIGKQDVFEKTLSGLSPLDETDGKKVYKGEILTNGALDIKEYKDIVGDLLAQRYIIDESKKVYMSQGQNLNDKHIEVVVKQLFSKVVIQDPGESSLIPGNHIRYEEFLEVNQQLIKEGKKPAKGQRLARGLTNIAKSTDSWLSSASFQETIRVMVGASLKGAVDDLADLKSNVIIGRLLPVGDVYRKTQEKLGL